MYKKIIFKFIIIVMIFTHSFSIENKIILKIDNQIITSFDVYEEIKYLSLLNSDINKLGKDEIFEISKKTIEREKIKELEIYKQLGEFQINNQLFEKLIKIYSPRFGFNNKAELLDHLQKSNIDLDNFKKKILIEAAWNQLIYQKFNSKIQINEDELKKNILLKGKKNTSYLLSEIVFNINETSELDSKYEEIKKYITDKGFENAAINYSISSSANLGGKIGWFDENSLNNKIREKIFGLKINEHTKPILIPGGFLILKILEIKEVEKEINIKDELMKLVENKKTQQLNQYSNMYFNKVKKDFFINEK